MSQNSTVPDLCDLDDTEDVDESDAEQKHCCSDPITIMSPRKNSLTYDQVSFRKISSKN